MMNVDQALGYLLRDPQSVEAEAGRVLCDEILSRGQEVQDIKTQLAIAKTELASLKEAIASLHPTDRARFLAQVR
jgi:hypothetical protein